MLWSAPRSSTSTWAEPVVLDMSLNVLSEEMVRPGDRLMMSATICPLNISWYLMRVVRKFAGVGCNRLLSGLCIRPSAIGANCHPAVAKPLPITGSDTEVCVLRTQTEMLRA